MAAGRLRRVLTERRLLFAMDGVTRQTIEDFPMDKDGKQIADTVRARLANAAPPPPPAAYHAPPQPATPDVYEQLRKLGELRDLGVVTPDEFEQKKRDLLSRI